MLTSDDTELNNLTDHGVQFRMPANYTGFRDPARAFYDKEHDRMCAVVGAGKHDCEEASSPLRRMLV